MDSSGVISSIVTEKDLDGFHLANMGKLVTGLESVHLFTPRGIMYLFEEYGIDPEGKEAVIIGRSNIAGKPVVHMLLDSNTTVTVCHSRTKDIGEHTGKADILIAALSRPRFITSDMLKEGAVVFDVGINRLEEGLVGDMDLDNFKDRFSWIAPVPGGVGPITIAMLLLNTMEADKGKNKESLEGRYWPKKSM